MTKTEENWFLRGGKRPEQEEPKEKTVFCPNCGGENLSDEEYCTHCGQPIVIEPRFEHDHMNRFACQNCGKPHLGGAKFCPHCGVPLAGEADEGNPHDTDPCDECDGRTRCDDCPHNLDRGDDGQDCDDDEREFEVTVSRFRTVKQEMRVTVFADCEDSAMEKAEYLAGNHGDIYNWEDVEGSEEVDDIGAEEVEEL